MRNISAYLFSDINFPVIQQQHFLPQPSARRINRLKQMFNYMVNHANPITPLSACWNWFKMAR